MGGFWGVGVVRLQKQKMKQTENSSQSGVNRDSNEGRRGWWLMGAGLEPEVEGGHLAYLPRQAKAA